MAKTLVNTIIETIADGTKTICYMYNDNGNISYEYKTSGDIKEYIAQELGDSEDKIVSQKVVTESLKKTTIY